MSKAKSIDAYNSPFATRLREIMDNNPNITQQQVADYLGVTRQSISQYMNGNSQATADKIILLTQFFNVSADYLLGITDIKTADTSVQSVSHYLGVNDKIVEGLKSEIDFIKSECNPGEEKELFEVLEKMLLSEDKIIYSMLDSIVNIVTDNDYKTFFSSNVWKEIKTLKTAVSLAGNSDYYEFMVYKKIFNICSTTAKEIGSFFTTEELDCIENATSKQELISLADKINSPIMRNILKEWIEDFKYEIFYKSDGVNPYSKILDVFNNIGDDNG